MSRDESLEPSNLEAPYTRLLFQGLMSVYEKWVHNYHVEALTEALKLVVFLPTDVKEVMWNKAGVIEKDLGQAYGTQGSDFFLTNLKRNRTAQRVANIHLGPFVDEMVRRLDEKGWLHRGALRARYKTDRKLNV